MTLTLHTASKPKGWVILDVFWKEVELELAEEVCAQAGKRVSTGPEAGPCRLVWGELGGTVMKGLSGREPHFGCVTQLMRGSRDWPLSLRRWDLVQGASAALLLPRLLAQFLGSSAALCFITLVSSSFHAPLSGSDPGCASGI